LFVITTIIVTITIVIVICILDLLYRPDKSLSVSDDKLIIFCDCRMLENHILPFPIIEIVQCVPFFYIFYILYITYFLQTVKKT